jgi:hypothetical protein
MKNVAISWFMNHESQAYGQLDLGVASEQEAAIGKKGNRTLLLFRKLELPCVRKLFFP